MQPTQPSDISQVSLGGDRPLPPRRYGRTAGPSAMRQLPVPLRIHIPLPSVALSPPCPKTLFCSSIAQGAPTCSLHTRGAPASVTRYAHFVHSGASHFMTHHPRAAALRLRFLLRSPPVLPASFPSVKTPVRPALRVIASWRESKICLSAPPSLPPRR